MALAIHLGTYCAVAVCFAFGVYEFMQPSLISNPGLAAYKPPPGTVLTYIPSFTLRREFATVDVSVGAAPETDGLSKPSAAEPADREVTPEKPKRPQPVYRAERRDPTRDYAARSFSDRSTRPWY
jgi:hypothetical protein